MYVHTHTHIYIYIYIYYSKCILLLCCNMVFKWQSNSNAIICDVFKYLWFESYLSFSHYLPILRGEGGFCCNIVMLSIVERDLNIEHPY